MNFVAKLKAMLANGFANAEDKKAIKELFEKQGEDVKSLSEALMTEMSALPEEEPDVNAQIEENIKALFKGEQKGMTESMKAEIVAEVQELLTEHKENQKKEVGVYSEAVKKDEGRKLVNSYLREGLKSLIAKADTDEFTAIKNDMSTDDSASPYTGYITDDYLSAEIRHLTIEYGVAAKEFSTVSFSQSSYKANTLTTDLSVEWVDEGTAIGSTQVVLGQSTLEIKKMAAIITLTREILQEKEIDLVSFLGSRVAEGFARAEDEAFFIGDGSSTYGGHTGLLLNTATNNVAMATGDTGFANISVEYLRAMRDASPQSAMKNGKYAFHRSIMTQIMNLREDAVSPGDGKGAFIYKAPTGTSPANIDGFPIVLVEAMPSIGDSAVSTAFALFGDMKKATIRGIRGGIIVDTFTAGIARNTADDGDLNLITTDRTAVRWINQVGYISILPTLLTRLTTSAT